jgi:hypothetical protein
MKVAISKWAGHLPFHIAKEKLDLEGIELVIVETGPIRSEMFFKGECDAMVCSSNALISEFDAICKTGKIVFVLYSMKDDAKTGSDVIFCKKEFKDAQNLFEKAKIGVIKHSLEHAIFEYYFFKKGCRHKKDYFFVDKAKGRKEYVALLSSGEIDAAVFCQPDLDTIMEKANETDEFHRFPDEQEIFWPILIEFLIVRNRHLYPQTQKLRKLIENYIKSVKTIGRMSPDGILKKVPRDIYPKRKIVTDILENILFEDIESNCKMFAKYKI